MNLFEIIKNIEWYWIVGAFFAYYFIVFISKFVICKIRPHKLIESTVEFLKLIPALVSPDYFITKIIKGKYKKDQSKINEDDEVVKQKLGEKIKDFNSLNLVLSIILCIILFVIALISSNKWNNILIMLMMIRYLSRTLEVVISFVLDMFDGQNEKSSNLTPKERISLALKSFLEIFILAVTFIFLINNNIFNSFVIAFESIFNEFNECNNIKFVQLFLLLTFYAVISNYISIIIKNKEDKCEREKNIERK